MRSIDNLREYALTAASVNATTRAVLAGYVDEIEREVEEVRDREYRNGMEDGEMAAERDGWVRLPVDADGAGFTRHCWECVHATNWRKVISFDGNEADCELTGRHVEKHSSPNNQCSHVDIGCRYETREDEQ